MKIKCHDPILTPRLCTDNCKCTDVRKILDKPFKQQQRILNVLGCFCIYADTNKRSHTIYYVPWGG